MFAHYRLVEDLTMKEYLISQARQDLDNTADQLKFIHRKEIECVACIRELCNLCISVRQWIDSILHVSLCSCVEVDGGAARGGDEARARRARAADGAHAHGARGAGLRAEQRARPGARTVA